MKYCSDPSVHYPDARHRVHYFVIFVSLILIQAFTIYDKCVTKDSVQLLILLTFT